MHTDLQQLCDNALLQTLGEVPKVHSTRGVAGGCINNGLKLETSAGTFFLKWNEKAAEDMFEKEALGLEMLANTGSIPCPGVIGFGTVGTIDFLLLEFISTDRPTQNFWIDFGQKLAELHRPTQSQYGLDHDNYIGQLPQKNEPRDDWIDFFVENRLEVQLTLALYNGLIEKNFADRFRQLYARLPGMLTDEPPSLMHGDLWSGNFMVGPGGEAYIYDPAVYYGNREIELAFTRLFGGFDLQFYHAYNDAYPLEPGFEERSDIYNLYPLLVHVNLFGTSYLNGVESTMRKYV